MPSIAQRTQQERQSFRDGYHQGATMTIDGIERGLTVDELRHIRDELLALLERIEEARDAT